MDDVNGKEKMLGLVCCVSKSESWYGKIRDPLFTAFSCRNWFD